MLNTGKAAVVFLMLMLSSAAFANNLSVSTEIHNVALVGKNPSSHTYDIRFDISQDNSWFIAGAPSSTANWDAVWVFAKYSTWEGSAWGDWKHCKLLNTGYSAPEGSQLDFGQTEGVYLGAFLRRNSTGSGTVSWTNVSIRWDYGADGVDDTTIVKVKVFGIEMVYIPQGAFYLGSGGTESGSFTNGSWVSGATIPFQVTSEAVLTIASSEGNLWGTSTSGNNTIGPAGTLPAGYPKGFQAFYLMKYEITQGQYADFLNMLTSTQAASRYYSSLANRYTISGSHPNHSASRPDRVCNWLSWPDVAAYAAWSALRPFTELEFEKACRGPNSPVASEYAWGSTGITAAAAISGAEDGTETITTANANCCYGNKTFSGGDGGRGPLRAGIFAKSATTRAQAGAGYYGNMELSGNVWERPVTVGNSQGRLFTGSHGSGALSADGFATNADWPGIAAGEVSGATGVGFRGGFWHNGYTYVRASDRYYAACTSARRSYGSGGRLARTSP